MVLKANQSETSITAMRGIQPLQASLHDGMERNRIASDVDGKMAGFMAWGHRRDTSANRVMWNVADSSRPGFDGVRSQNKSIVGQGDQDSRVAMQGGFPGLRQEYQMGMGQPEERVAVNNAAFDSHIDRSGQAAWLLQNRGVDINGFTHPKMDNTHMGHGNQQMTKKADFEMHMSSRDHPAAPHQTMTSVVFESMGYGSHSMDIAERRKADVPVHGGVHTAGAADPMAQPRNEQAEEVNKGDLWQKLAAGMNQPTYGDGGGHPSAHMMSHDTQKDQHHTYRNGNKQM